MTRRARKPPAPRQHIDDIVERAPVLIGERIRTARAQAGLTLDGLAERSGVSRRMIVNIEAGESNASIATLLRLANALTLPLAELVDDAESAGIAIWRSATSVPLWAGPLGGSAVMVASAATPAAVELWEWVLAPGESYQSPAHSTGTIELLHVQAGRLQITVDGIVHDLAKGDGLRFAASVPHAYANTGRSQARMSMTVYEPTPHAPRERGVVVGQEP